MNKSKKKSIFVRLIYSINVLIGIALLGAYLSTHISPNSISYLPFLGLSYPFLILILACFSFLWLFIDRKWVIFNVLVFLLGWNHFTDFYAFNNAIQVHHSNDLKIMSYNVRIFNYYDVKNRIKTRNNIFKFIQKEKADVFCFQEFYHQENSLNFKTRDTLISILSAKNYHERFTHEMTGKQFFGVVTFSKYPIINKGGIKFKNDDNNYCIYTDLVKNNDTIRVFNAHLGSIRLKSKDYAVFGGEENEKNYKIDTVHQNIIGRLKLAFEKRAVQIEKVMAEIKKSPYPVVLCGDFNDTPVSYCYRQVVKLLQDAFIESGNGIGTTYIGKIPSNRIDYIFHSNQLKGTEFVVHDVNYSDHKPISCYIGNVND